MIRSYINCEHLIVITCKLDSKTIVLRCFVNCKIRSLWKTYNKVHMLIKIQPDATVSRYLFTAKSLYMFRVSQHQSSRVLKTVTATSGTGHIQLLPSNVAWSGLVCASRVEGVTPETCRVTLQWINICILLHLVGFLLTLNCDARNHELKKLRML